MRTVAVAVAATALLACHQSEAKRKPLPPDQAAELLHDRVWLDHAPRTPSDRFQLVMFDETGGAIRQHRTIWKGDFEVFFHEVDGGELEYFLPASGTTMRSTFRITPVDGPDHADHKLVIDHPPTGPREYFGWRLERGTADAWLAKTFGTPAR
ncbi:MAG: hypothetical protein IPL61_29205 [Myxococcales bacterium]|nr:hypothetical protein [Myxococcales bacterium]